MTGSRHDVEVILVGDELLKGERRDAHLPFLGESMLRLGIRIGFSHTVGDDVARIAEVLSDRLPHARVIVITGGLGPTDDDITRDGVARALHRELEFHAPSWQKIEEFFASRGRQATENNRQQAHFPAGAVVFENDLGTAPAFSVEHEGCIVYVLPGPPRELQPVFERHIAPHLAEMFDREPVRVETFRTVGIGESQLVSALGDALTAIDGYRVSYLPSITGVDIVLTQKPGFNQATVLDSEAAALESSIRDMIGSKLYARGRRSLSEVVAQRLVETGATVSVAESLTGGWISKMFTDIPGSSEFLLADVVAYSNESKEQFLGVRNETLVEYGAVSEEVCTEMAHGARNRGNATFGLATTGIAGPTGGTPKKPVGLVYLGVAFEGGSHIKRALYTGDRDIIRLRACHGVLWMLFDHLQTQ